MRTLVDSLRRHWGKFVVLVFLVSSGVAYAVTPVIRQMAYSGWQSTLEWAGVGGGEADSGKVFWCPMHPQIKSKKENYVCPICNMALVELEGGIVAAPQHLALTAQQIQQAGVVTQPVLRRKLFREVDTTGRIDYDERRLAKITSWISGKSRIEKLYVNYQGDVVKSGEPLAEIYSPDLIVARDEYLVALKALANQSANPFQKDLLASTREKLKRLGLSEKQIDEFTSSKKEQDRIPILAPIGGTVHRRNVVEGQYVTEGEVLFELVDLSRLWVFADIFEEEVPLAKLGLPIEVLVPSLPGKVFYGEIAFIDHMVKPGTRTVPIRIDVENKEHQLKAGMFARVRLRHDWPAALAVPENAVLWSGQRSVVILQLGDGLFQPREVQLGRKWLYAIEDGNRQSRALGFGEERVRYHEVLAGLAPGDKVVAAGAFLLNAESQFQNVLAKMLPPASKGVTLEEALGDSVASSLRGVLAAYFDLVTVLAEDRLEDVPKRIELLSQKVGVLQQSAQESEWKKLSDDASQFSIVLREYCQEPAKDLGQARRQFGAISHHLATLLSIHGGRNLMGKDLFFFECGMANVGYERWLWRTPQIYNPYMGTKRKMLTCGKRLDALEP